MAVTENNLTYQAEGNGAARDFAFPWTLHNPLEMIVTLDPASGPDIPLVADVDYTIHNLGKPNGFIRYEPTSGPLPAGDVLKFEYVPTLLHDTDFSNQGGFQSTIHQREFDRLTKAGQYIDRRAQRGIRVPDDEDVPNALPDRASRRGGFLAFTDTSSAQPMVTDIDTVITNSQTQYEFTIAGSATDTLSGSDDNGMLLEYPVGIAALKVYWNGEAIPPSDYTATTGTSIVLLNGIQFEVGDTVVVIARNSPPAFGGRVFADGYVHPESFGVAVNGLGGVDPTVNRERFQEMITAAIAENNGFEKVSVQFGPCNIFGDGERVYFTDDGTPTGTQISGLTFQGQGAHCRIFDMVFVVGYQASVVGNASSRLTFRDFYLRGGWKIVNVEGDLIIDHIQVVDAPACAAAYAAENMDAYCDFVFNNHTIIRGLSVNGNGESGLDAARFSQSPNLHWAGGNLGSCRRGISYEAHPVHAGGYTSGGLLQGIHFEACTRQSVYVSASNGLWIHGGLIRGREEIPPTPGWLYNLYPLVEWDMSLALSGGIKDCYLVGADPAVEGGTFGTAIKINNSNNIYVGNCQFDRFKTRVDASTAGGQVTIENNVSRTIEEYAHHYILPPHKTRPIQMDFRQPNPPKHDDILEIKEDFLHPDDINRLDIETGTSATAFAHVANEANGIIAGTPANIASDIAQAAVFARLNERVMWDATPAQWSVRLRLALQGDCWTFVGIGNVNALGNQYELNGTTPTAGDAQCGFILDANATSYTWHVVGDRLGVLPTPIDTGLAPVSTQWVQFDFELSREVDTICNLYYQITPEGGTPINGELLRANSDAGFGSLRVVHAVRSAVAGRTIDIDFMKSRRLRNRG